MTLPFTLDEFLGVFAAYNNAVWPAQILLVSLALAIVIAGLKQPRFSGFGPVVLGVLWAWSGLMYHVLFFRNINGAALAFAFLFLIQAGVLVSEGVKLSLNFRFTWSLRGWVGAAVMLYALVLYPLFGYALGHRYPESPTFGAPCPVTIFTLGILLWSAQPLKWYVYAIPLAWSIIATSAALSLGMREDLGLTVSAVLFVAVLIGTRSRDRAVLSGLSAAR